MTMSAFVLIVGCACAPFWSQQRQSRKEWRASAPYEFDLKKSKIVSAASSPVRTQSEMPTP